MKKRILFVTLCIISLFAVFYAGYLAASATKSTEKEQELVIETIPYETLFRQYADSIGWDWELLAALAWEESHYNPEAKSYVGATGIMQLMPTTAERFGLNDSTILLPEHNIRAGVKYIASLQRIYDFINNPQEQIHFVLASYNAGPAHIMDARRLAKRYGRSPYVWFDNTEYWLEQLNNPTIAADSVVHYGSFNAIETTSYVRKVLRTYNRIQKKVADNSATSTTSTTFTTSTTSSADTSKKVSATSATN